MQRNFTNTTTNSSLIRQTTAKASKAAAKPKGTPLPYSPPNNDFFMWWGISVAIIWGICVGIACLCGTNPTNSTMRYSRTKFKTQYIPTHNKYEMIATDSNGVPVMLIPVHLSNSSEEYC